MAWLLEGGVQVNTLCCGVSQAEHDVPRQLVLNIQSPGVVLRRTAGVIGLPIRYRGVVVDRRTAVRWRGPRRQSLIEQRREIHDIAILRRPIRIEDQSVVVGTAASSLQRGEGACRIHANHRAAAHLVSQSETRSPGFLETVEQRALARASVGTVSGVNYGSQPSACRGVGHAGVEVFKTAGITAQAGLPVGKAEDRSSAYRAGVLIAQPEIQSQPIVNAPIVLKESTVVVIGLKHGARRLETHAIRITEKHGGEAIATGIGLVSRNRGRQGRKREIAIRPVLPDAPPVVGRKEKSALEGVGSFHDGDIVIEVKIPAKIAAPRVTAPGGVLRHGHGRQSVIRSGSIWNTQLGVPFLAPIGIHIDDHAVLSLETAAQAVHDACAESAVPGQAIGSVLPRPHRVSVEWIGQAGWLP